MDEVTIYTDGACSGNPGKGGWGAILMCGNLRKEISGAEKETTNNRMELLSAISALKALKESAEQFQINVYSDSQYVVKGITEWYRGWELKNYYQVKNPELWKELVALKNKFPNINFIWVKGHDKNAGNLEVDKLCNDAMDGKI